MRPLDALYRRIRMTIARAVIALVDDAKKEQIVQLTLVPGETRDAERYQHYGFTSHPHPGGEAIVVAVGGSRDHLVVVADGDRRYRLKNLGQGEVAIYDDLGQAVHLTRQGIAIYGTEQVTVTAPETAFTGNVTIGGGLVITGPVTAVSPVTAQSTVTAVGAIASTGGGVADATGTLQEIRATYNLHKHGTSPVPDILM